MRVDLLILLNSNDFFDQREYQNRPLTNCKVEQNQTKRNEKPKQHPVSLQTHLRVWKGNILVVLKHI